MRIGIDGSPMLAVRGGVGRYASDLLRALLDLKEDLEFVCYVRPGALRSGKSSPLGDRWPENPSLRWVEAGPTAIRWRGTLDRLDLYHGINFKMQTRGRYGGVVTIHDLWLDRYPQYSKKLLGQWASFYRTRRTARRARKVITISQHSASEIQTLYGLPPDRIAIVHNGVSQTFQPNQDPESFADLRKRLAIPDRGVILFVGGANPRKNHQALLRAYAFGLRRLERYSLVMVGDSSDRFGDIRITAHGLGIDHRVSCVGHVPVDDLKLLYSHAELFVFPSIYEGFGMPVLEAMACGAPVITSSTTSLPEVAGDAAILVNPEDENDLADAMTMVLEHPSLRETLKQKGFQRAKLFTWEDAAARTMAVYRDLCQ